MIELLELLTKATVVLTAGFLAVAGLRDATAGTRHAVWVATFMGLLVLPLAGRLLPALPLPLLPAATDPEPSQTLVVSPGSPESTSPRSPAEPPKRLRESRSPWILLLAVYLTGAVAVLAHLVAGLWRVHRLTLEARTGSRDPGWRHLLEELHPHGGRHLARPVAILVSPRVAVPFTWGASAPRSRETAVR